MLWYNEIAEYLYIYAPIPSVTVLATYGNVNINYKLHIDCI